MSEPDGPDNQAALARILAATSAPELPTREAALAALITLRHLRDRLDAWEPQLIAAARAAGTSWAELAPAMGVASRQAAERRYLRIRRTDHDDTGATADQRVTAERDRRAGTRAITDWARANSADLRQLAGQITALTDLGPDAQPSLDRLHHALGAADPAALLPLLAAVHEHLQTQHAGLADQVTTVSQNANQIRHDTQQRREHRRGPDPGQTSRTDPTR
ncbi:hypothetical protein [Krasilnikovia sp. M28-CT-15]|uniref:hypothetical protein n=1 Tax=Krasilnikovia sp. M28-CT-15 TaxID=3373540 RepID=UPI0038766576